LEKTKSKQYLLCNESIYHVVIKISIPSTFKSQRIHFGVVSNNTSLQDHVPGSSAVGFGWQGSGALGSQGCDIEPSRLPPWSWGQFTYAILGLEINGMENTISAFNRNIHTEIRFKSVPEEFYFAVGAHICSFKEKLQFELLHGSSGRLHKDSFSNFSRCKHKIMSDAY